MHLYTAFVYVAFYLPLSMLQSGGIRDLFAMKEGEALSNYTIRVQGIYCQQFSMCGVQPDLSQHTFTRPYIDVDCFEYLCKEGGCYCDQNCSIYGDCCPNARGFSRRMGSSLCTDLNIKGLDNHIDKPKMYAMVSKCPSDYTDNDIVSKCQSTKTLNARELKSNIPVSSSSHITFRNQYCAICHKATVYTTWKFRVVCTELLKLPSNKSKHELLDMLLESDKCDFQLIPPKGEKFLRECTTLSGVISECNTDAEQVWADKCSLYTTIFMKRYRNVFCFLCSGKVNVRKSDNCQLTGEKGEQYQYPSFSAALDSEIESINQPNGSMCQRGFKYDAYKNTCREIHCPLGKWLRVDKCKVIIQLKGIYSFETTIVYTFNPDEHQSNRDIADSVDIPLIPRSYSNILKTISSVKSVILMDIGNLRYCRNCSNIAVAFTFTVEVAVIEWDIDEIENIVNNLTKERHSVRLSKDGNISLVPNEALTALYEAKVNSIANISTAITYIDKENKELRKLKSKYYLPAIKTNRFNVCSNVRINVSEIVMNEDQHTIFIPALNTSLHPGQYSILNENTVVMCSDAYFDSIKVVEHRGTSTIPNPTRVITTNYEKTDTPIFSDVDRLVCHLKAANSNNIFNNNITKTDEENIQGADNSNKVFRIVAQCVSTTALLVTLIGYCVEKSLQSHSGIKTMTFLVCTLFAQNAHLFGVDQTGNDMACKAIGICIHCAWLAAATLINAGSFYLFRIFGSLLNVEMPSPDSKFELIAWMCYVFTVPSICILINIFGSLMYHDDLGYGHYQCFITHPSMLFYSFILPMGIVLFTNILVTTIILTTIRGMKGIQTIAAADRKYTIMFLMTSTLMAVAWACGFTYELTCNVYASYLFAILNSLIGVCCFVSFYWNLEVLKESGERRKLYMVPEALSTLPGITGKCVTK